MIDETLNSYRLILHDARRMVEDLSEEQMRERPMGLNPPAWILGHLVYSAMMMGGEMEIAPWLSESWKEMFRTGSRPSELTAYPGKAELLGALDDAFGRLSRRLREIGEEGLEKPLPDEKCRAELPTIGHAIVHIISGHASLHVGQLSAWRRAMGLARKGI